jgi:putative flippase GtrA
LSRQVLQDNEQPVALPHEQLDPKMDGERRKFTLSEIWQFLRFCVVGSLNAIIDFAVLDLLLWIYPTSDTTKILLFNSIAVLLAATNSFFWNKYWTFRNRQPISMAEIGRFVVVAGATAALNDALMLLLTLLFPRVMNSSLIGANLLKLGAILGTTSVSFFGMRLWVFFQRRHAPLPSLIADLAREEQFEEIAECNEQ